jgi:DNA-3-methyladenine glycosylase II
MRTPQDQEAEALQHLREVDSELYQLALRYPGVVQKRVTPARTRAGLFRTLASSIIGQQLSVHAAAAIERKVITHLGGLRPQAILHTSSETLRSLGLSSAKVRTLKELSQAVSSNLDLLKLRKVPHDAAIAELTSIWGIGSWTAEMFLIFALGAEDVFSPKDLGLVRAMERVYGLPKNPLPAQLHALADRWSPHRSFACLVLWEVHDSR